MKRLVHFFRFMFDNAYRKKWREDRLKFVQGQIETIHKENVSASKLLDEIGFMPNSVEQGLRHNRGLLAYFLDEEEKLRAKLKI